MNKYLLIFFMCCATVSVAQKKVNVYAFVAEECPISIFMASSLKTISDTYGEKVKFYLVFPFATSTAKTAAEFKTKNKLSSFIIKMDHRQVITKKLSATVTPEVVVTSEEDVILYKGRINDAYLQPGKRKHIFSGNDLANAMVKIMNDQEVQKPWRKAVGCLITQAK